MARSFVAASIQRLTSTTFSSLNSATKATLVATLKRTASGNVIGAGATASGTNRFYINLFSDGKLYLNCSNGNVASGSVNNTSTAWQRIVMVYDGTGSTNADKVKCWLDGTQQTLSFGDAHPTSLGTLNRFDVGFRNGAEYSNGSAQEVAAYNTNLTAEEAVQYCNGFSPLMVRPQSLVGYWPLLARNGTGNEDDWVGGWLLTHNANPAVTDHQRIIYPRRRTMIFVPSAGGGPITGTLTRTLGALTSASAAALAIAGTSSRTLGALTSSSTAKVDIAGTSSVTLGAATLSSTGEIAAAVGTFDQTLGALTASSAAALAIAGTSSVTLGALTSASAAELSIAGTATPTLGALTSSGAAALAIDGTLTKTLGALTLSSDASIVSGLAGSADITLGALTSSAAAALSIAGSTSATLGALTSTAAGSVDIAATLGVTLGDITLSATGNTAQPLEATLTATLGAMTASCAGAVYTAGAVRPVSDTTPGAWLPSVGGDLYATIDEAIVDDADYDYTESASTMRLALGAMTDPGVNYGHAFTYRIKGDGSATLYARIGAGGTTVATYTHAPAPATLTTYRQVLSSGEVDTFRSNSGYTGGWIEFEAA